MTQFFNDRPIERAEEDRYGITPFARSLAKSIRSIEAPFGTCIALNGPWGSGKSSAVNLIRHELESASDEALEISDFKCWWYKGEEALVLAFLQNLNALLTNTLKKKVKKLVPKLGHSLLQASPSVGSAVATTTGGPIAGVLTGAGLTFTRRFFPKGDTVEKTFRNLAEILEKEQKRFLIIIDDIDRLGPEEALAIFRMIKSVGCLPTVMYLLVFDRALADKVVAERYPSEGPHFLEKIIQASFELPMPIQTDINNGVLAAIQETCGTPDDVQLNRFQNIFHDVVVPYIQTPRHVVRIQNVISVTWPAIAGEVCLADFIALETLRLYEPKLFQAIRSNKLKLCGPDRELDLGQEVKADFEFYLSEVKKDFHDVANLALQRLFPRMEPGSYGGEFLVDWDAERRVCVEEHFDTYFRLFLSDEKLPIERINELIEKADDRDFIQEALREAAASHRRSGTSKVPVILDELIAHAPKISKEKVGPLLSALFEIHDEINLEIDVDHGYMTFGSTNLRYLWLAGRLTSQRFTLSERTNLYMITLRQASLGWLVEFVYSAKSLYRERETGPLREEDYLVQEDAIDELIESALKAIRLSAANNSLLNHQNLIDILYRWRDFLDNDPSEVRGFTDPLLENDAALVIFARKSIGETWSQGVGDRVAKRGTKLLIDKQADIFDIPMLCSRLEALLKADTLNEEDQKTVQNFLEAWQKTQRE